MRPSRPAGAERERHAHARQRRAVRVEQPHLERMLEARRHRCRLTCPPDDLQRCRYPRRGVGHGKRDRAVCGARNDRVAAGAAVGTEHRPRRHPGGVAPDRHAARATAREGPARTARGSAERDRDTGDGAGQRTPVRVGERHLQVRAERRVQLRRLRTATRERQRVGRIRGRTRRVGCAAVACAGTAPIASPAAASTTPVMGSTASQTPCREPRIR